MSAETCGGFVPFRWHSKKENYFLRDDKDAGLCDHERYSLFRENPYGRIAVLRMPLRKAVKEAVFEIVLDRQRQSEIHECVACGIRYKGDHHKCDPKKIQRIEDGRSAHDELLGDTPPTYYDRLRQGFKMLQDFA